jgi:hypothetical protein
MMWDQAGRTTTTRQIVTFLHETHTHGFDRQCRTYETAIQFVQRLSGVAAEENVEGRDEENAGEVYLCLNSTRARVPLTLQESTW